MSHPPTYPLSQQEPLLMPNILSCRPESYGRYRDRALESLQQLGISYVEIAAPSAENLPEVEKQLARYGLRAASVTLVCRAQEANFLDRTRQTVDSAIALGAPVIFTSQHTGDLDRSRLFERLRQAGDIAAAKNVVIALETHPDLCQNGSLALVTMQEINHPNVRINFDPA